MNASKARFDPRWPPLRTWATRQLKLSGEPTVEAVRQATMRQLADWDFVPPERWQQACEVLLVPTDATLEPSIPPPSTHGREGILTEVGEQLRQEVEDFAIRFFSFSVDLRRDRWRELRERCADYPSRVWQIDRLEQGLSIEPGSVPDTYAELKQLAGEVAQLFVLPPQQQAARRQSLISQKLDNITFWVWAAKKLREEHPAVAGLADEYVQTLANWHATQLELEKARGRAAKARLDMASRRAKEFSRQRSAQPAFGGWPIGAVVIALMALVRFVGSGTSTYNKSSYSYAPPKNITIPPYDHNSPGGQTLDRLFKLSPESGNEVGRAPDGGVPQSPFDQMSPQIRELVSQALSRAGEMDPAVKRARFISRVLSDRVTILTPIDAPVGPLGQLAEPALERSARIAINNALRKSTNVLSDVASDVDLSLYTIVVLQPKVIGKDEGLWRQLREELRDALSPAVLRAALEKIEEIERTCKDSTNQQSQQSVPVILVLVEPKLSTPEKSSPAPAPEEPAAIRAP